MPLGGETLGSGQSNGNYLAYCCLDSTAKFCKFGHMLLLNGIEGSNQKYSSYVDLIKNLNSYGLQFWTICQKHNQTQI